MPYVKYVYMKTLFRKRGSKGDSAMELNFQINNIDNQLDATITVY